ncbi:hypothetical protein SAMN05444398_103271 [Roseovarius pacificus]|uniref:Uncharacterized protein n=1 Tax=Roseovarius pacificus TaxID=337701 RepID=A0A1M7BKN3_9RHOB|nr:hypothetical protein [Roseovarius pacificus]GGO55198.1 hypothetical protein GCM10011315_17170 [Roseovarius pacificus]SHL55129.1 hypothetical protein SAMN05444398_103271 [Roseovarius pacificus]
MKRLEKSLCAALRDHLAGSSLRLQSEYLPIWDAFLALSRARSCGPTGPNPIGYPEIDAYARLMRLPLEPRHVACIAAMDRVWVDQVYRGRNVPEGVKVLPQRSGQALTPGLFDAMIG